MSGRPMSSTTASGTALCTSVERGRAALGQPHLVAVELQRAAQHLAQAAVIVDHEQSHATHCARPRTPGASRSYERLRRPRAGRSAGAPASAALAVALAQRRGEDPVDEPRRLGAAEPLGGLDRLVDRALGRDRALARDRVGVQQLEQRDAQDRALERRDPARATSRSRGARSARRARPGDRAPPIASARVNACTSRGERLLERPLEQIALIQRPDRGAALLGPTHVDTYSPERVSTRTTSPMLTNSGTWIRAPGLEHAGLLPPPEAVSPRTPGSVSVTSRSIALGSCTSAGCSSM